MGAARQQDVLINEVLQNYATEYQPEGLIGDRLISRVLVSKPAATFRKRKRENNTRILDGRVGETGKPAELSLAYDSAKFACEDFAFMSPVPVATRDAADAVIDLEMDAIRQLKWSMKIAEEVRIANLLTNPANFATPNKIALVGTAQWSDYVNSDPIPVLTDMVRRIKRSGTAQRRMWAGSDVWQVLQHHPKVLARLGLNAGATSSLPAQATIDAFKRLIGVEEFVVATAELTGTNPGQAAAWSYLWGKNLGITTVEPNPTTISLSFASQFVWVDSELSAWADSEPGLRGAIKHKIAQSATEELVANDAGILISTAVA